MSTLLRAGLAALGLGVGLALVPAAGLAAGKLPVALILDVSAGTGIESYSEVRSGDRIALAEDGQVEFLHYGSCQSVVVRGGELTFSDERYTVRQGKVVEAKRATCPTQATLRGETQVGGVVLRGAELTMEPTAGFLLVGGWQGKVATVTIRKGEQVVLQQPVRAAQVTWPAGSPPLEVGATYVLELGGAQPRTTEFRVVRAAGSGKAVLALVRVE